MLTTRPFDPGAFGREQDGDLCCDVVGIAVGDHVVINPMAAPGDIISKGEAAAALCRLRA
jgi:hypothetical protein